MVNRRVNMTEWFFHKACFVVVALVVASFCSAATSDPVGQRRYPRIYNAYITTDKQLQPSKAYPHSVPVLQPGFLGPPLLQPGLLGPVYGPELYGPDRAPLQEIELEQNDRAEGTKTQETEQPTPETEPLTPGTEPPTPDTESFSPETESFTPGTESFSPETAPKISEDQPQKSEVETQTDKQLGDPAISITGEKIYPTSRQMSKPTGRQMSAPTGRQMSNTNNYPLTFYPRSIGYYPHPFIPYSYPLAPQPFVFGGGPPGLGAPQGIYNYPTQVFNQPPYGYPFQGRIGDQPPNVGLGNQLPMSYKATHQSSVEMNTGGMEISNEQNESNVDDTGSDEESTDY